MNHSRICWLATAACCLLLSPSVAVANSVLVTISRIDDFVFPMAAFNAAIEVELTAAGVSGVKATLGTGGPVVLELSPDGIWELPGDVNFASLADMKAALNGTWTVEVIGGANASTTTFTLNANSLINGDFFPTPTGLSPADGAMDVSASVPLSWNAAGIVAPFAVGAEVDSNEGLGGQSAFSLEGTIALSATSWQPPALLPNGLNEWGVFYVAEPLSEVALIGDPVVTTGSIIWDTHPLAPEGWPAGRPLLALLAETIVQITVPEPGRGLLSSATLAVLGLLAWIRSGRLRSGNAVVAN